MNVFDLMATISLDTSKYDSELKNSESKIKKAGAAIRNGLKTAAKVGAAAIGAATTAVGALVTKSISEYADYEQLVGGVEKLFGKSADQMMKYAANAYKTSGMSANDYMEQSTSFAAALINSLGGDTAKAADQADVAMRAISDNFNTFGGDIQNVQNAFQGFAKQNYTMLDNLKLGYGGTKTEMERLIADANEYGKATGQASDLTIESFSDIVTAIDLIQQKQNIAGTTSKEAATTIEGSVNSTKAAWTNLLTGVANGDADVAKLTKEFLDSAKTAFNNILPVAKQSIIGISKFVIELAPGIKKELPKLISSIIPMIEDTGKQLFNGIIKVIIDSAPKIKDTVLGIINQGITIFSENKSSIFSTISDFISEISNFLIDGIPQFSAAIEKINSFVINIIPDAVQLITSMLPKLTELVLKIGIMQANNALKIIPVLLKQIPIIIVSIVDKVLSLVPLVVNAGIELLSSLVKDLPAIINMVVSIVPKLIQNLISTILKHAPKILNAGIKLFSALVQNLPKIISIVVKAVPKLTNALVKTILSEIPKIAQTGLKLIVSLIKNLPQMISETVSAVKSILSSILSAIGDFSLVDAGVNLIKGLWKGIENTKDWLFNQVSGLAKGLTKKVKDVFKIKSPSRVFADEIGKFLALGLGEGWEDTFPAVQDGIEDDLNFDVRKTLSDIEASIDTNGIEEATYTIGDLYVMMGRILSQLENNGTEMVSAIENSDTRIVLNNRELGRAVRKYA